MIPNFPIELTKAEEYILRELSQKPRAGWLRCGIPLDKCETVAEHSMKVALASAAYGSSHPELDSNLMVRLALVHDTPEIITPDYTPHDNISAEQEHQEEVQAMESLRPALGEEADGIIALWQGYRNQDSPEAHIVHQLDKIDATVQSLIYAKASHNVKEFYPYARARVTEPALIKILDTMVSSNAAKPYEAYYEMLRNS